MRQASLRTPPPLVPLAVGLAIAALANWLFGGLLWLDWIILILLPVNIVMAREAIAAGCAATRNRDKLPRMSEFRRQRILYCLDSRFRLAVVMPAVSAVGCTICFVLTRGVAFAVIGAITASAA